MISYIFVALIGAIIGSFLNVCIYRIPLKESIVFPSSHCGTCSHDLGWLDLIPILSYLLLRGRCRYCGQGISLQYPIIELTNGVLYLLVYYYFANTLTALAYAILFSILLVIAVIDQRTMRIPNSLIIFGLGVATVYKLALAVIALDPKLFFQGLLGFLLGGASIGLIMVFSLVIFRKEGMGMGDLKLLAMIGLFTSSRYVLYTLAIAVLLGAIYAAFLLMKKREGHMPFGPFLSMGGLVAILWWDALLSLYVNYML